MIVMASHQCMRVKQYTIRSQNATPPFTYSYTYACATLLALYLSSDWEAVDARD